MRDRCSPDAERLSNSHASARQDAAHRLNRRSYSAIATQWQRARRQVTASEAGAVQQFMTHVATDAVVLDLGCGSGQPMAGLLLARGNRVHGIDQSAAMLELAKANFPAAQFPRASWQLAAIESVNFPAGMPDGISAIICWDVLFHVRREWHADLFARMATALPCGGILLLSCGGSPQPPFTDRMFGRQFFYDSHDPAQTVRLLDASGFEVIWQAIIDEPDAATNNKGRAALLARRR